MSQAQAESVQQQVSDAIVEALKEAWGFFWLRSREYANPYVVRLT